MTATNTWKATERRWARLVGEERSGPTGRDLPDTTNTICPLALEVKCQGRRMLRAADVMQARQNATKVGLPWALVLHTTGSQGSDDVVVLSADAFLMLLSHHPNYREGT